MTAAGPLRLTPLRLTPLRLTPLRLASLRLASLRLTPLRLTSLLMHHPWPWPHAAARTPHPSRIGDATPW